MLQYAPVAPLSLITGWVGQQSDLRPTSPRSDTTLCSCVNSRSDDSQVVPRGSPADWTKRHDSHCYDDHPQGFATSAHSESVRRFHCCVDERPDADDDGCQVDDTHDCGNTKMSRRG